MNIHFGKGKELVYLCHEYMEARHMRPPSFVELFEFMRFNKTKGILHELSMAIAKDS